jgi:hypothetical protein
MQELSLRTRRETRRRKVIGLQTVLDRTVDDAFRAITLADHYAHESERNVSVRSASD